MKRKKICVLPKFSVVIPNKEQSVIKIDDLSLDICKDFLKVFQEGNFEGKFILNEKVILEDDGIKRSLQLGSKEIPLDFRIPEKNEKFRITIKKDTIIIENLNYETLNIDLFKN